MTVPTMLLVLGVLVAGALVFALGWMMGRRTAVRGERGEVVTARGAALRETVELRAPRRWVARASDVLGYESLQLTVGWQKDWLTPRGIAVGGDQVIRDLSLALRRSETIALLGFVLSMGIYALTRLVALDQFPINFFADEANQVIQAVELVKRGFRDPQGGLLPVYFNVFFFNNPDISVYLHVITASLFGQSIVVARATSAILTIIAVGAVGLLMKQVFQARYWWVVVLLLAITPLWFLFSRAAFDNAAMTSLYALTIAFYLFYRYCSPRYIYATVIAAAATFYAYPSGQPAIALLAIMLLASDFRYHWQHRRTLLWAASIIVIAAIPAVRFSLLHPEEVAFHLHAANSFWMQDISLPDKFVRTVTTYLELLWPGTWFVPNAKELARHSIKGAAYLPLIEFPLLLAGVGVSLLRWRESKYRVVLAALLAAPVGAALAEIDVLRALAFVMPAAIVSAIGLEWLLGRIKQARAVTAVSLVVFVILGGMSLGMLQDALTNGPTWYSDYTLYGMQWGAKQVFQDTVPRLMAENPNSQIYVSDSWANGTDVFPAFFALDPNRVKVHGVSGWLEKKLPLDRNTIFVMTPDEYSSVATSPKFATAAVESTIKYPDGRDGFYIAHLAYADNVDEIFAAERVALLQPVTDTVEVGGETVQVLHTKFDMGTAQAMFDGDLLSVARTIEANPGTYDFRFPSPRTLRGLTLYLGRTNVKVTMHLYARDSATPVDYESDFAFADSTTQRPAGPPAEVNFDNGPDTVTRMTMEIEYPESDQTAHIHVFELQFR